MKNWKMILVLGLLVVDGSLGWWLIWRDKTKVEIKYLIEKHYLKSDLEETFEKNKNNESKNLSALITSHHFLAKDLIAKTFAVVDKNKIKKIILVSPDHFKQIKDKNCLAETASVGWVTDFGIVEPELDEFKKLIKNKLVCQSQESFTIEHGVFTLIPFIKNYLPEAKVLAIILKPKKDREEFYKLGKVIAGSLKNHETLLVISSDFSHYISNKEAKKQDLVSEKELEEKDINDIDLIENDCRECVAFLFGYLGKNDKFQLVQNTNSFEISGEDENYVTSYINGYYLYQDRDE